MNSVPVVCDVCLVGGGHSHVLLIRRWAMNPLPGVRLTLISSAAMTPYSGMLPGLIAGHYGFEDIHIDLYKLCAWAGVRFIEQTMTSLDLQAKCVAVFDRPAVSFDVLSLDTGSTPDLSVPGARQFVTPVKPVHNFYARWQAVLDRSSQPQVDAVSIGVVGSGAGGFELVTAMRHRLPRSCARLYWLLRDELPISGRPARVGKLALEAARRAGITIIEGFDVARVELGELHASDGRHLQLDEVLWCTGASGPAWPESAGLAVDERGFVATNAHLQSTSHAFVFATGDIGTQVDTPSAKAGVFAVRQAPYLFENIRRFVQGDKLKIYRPQKDFLSLMATGGQRAIASRGPFAVEADWVWKWKDHIDQTFMRKLTRLPAMRANLNLQRLPDALRKRYGDSASPTVHSDSNERPTNMRCRGCGAKVGEQVLERVLTRVLGHGSDNSQPTEDDFSSAMHSPAGDTAVLRLTGTLLVQSVDQINAIIDDPYLIGRIAALHALSDVLTVDARLHSAQVIVTVPAGRSDIVERDLSQVMSGLLAALNQEGCALAGGHTLEGDELSVGVVINAELNDQADSAEVAVSSGDALILTQGVGIGLLFAGQMQQTARGVDISAAIEHMCTSNRRAAALLRGAGARHMTDVTGFGLLGHLNRLLSSLNLGATIYAECVPTMCGALDLAEQGIRSSLWPANSQVLDAAVVGASVSDAWLATLCDPQTSGGLLAIVPAGNARQCMADLNAAGYTTAAIIGQLDVSSVLTIQ